MEQGAADLELGDSTPGVMRGRRLGVFAREAPWRCERCGGPHSRRQRCLLDPPPPPLFADEAMRAAPAAPAVAVRGGVRAALISVLRWSGTILSTITLVTCLIVAGILIVDGLPHAGTNAGATLLALFICIGVGLSFGMGLMFVSMRVYAKVVFALLSVVLITGGSFMLIFAPVMRQMNTEWLAEYRAFNTLLAFGLLSLAGGIVLATACVRWAVRPHALRRLARWSRILGSIYGVLLGLYGLTLMWGLFSLINAESSFAEDGTEFSIVEQAIAFTFIAMWLFVPGLILTYHGISASMGEGSSEFRPPFAVAVLVLFAGVLAIGQYNMALESPVAAPMPVLHTLGAVLPGIFLVAMAFRGSPFRGRAVRGITWRQATLCFALSMAVAAMVAGYLNSIGGFGATVLLLVHNGAFVDVSSGEEMWEIIADANFILSDNEQWVANILAIAVIPPICEEFFKGLSVRLMLRRNTQRAQAFALGAAAGAGFGFLEALLYGLGAISDDLGFWWQIMLIRGGSTSLHVLQTGLVGLAWWYWTIGRRPRVALGLFGIAVLSHAVWNGVAVTLVSEILWLETLSSDTLETVAYIFAGVLASAFIIAIPIIARRLREPEPRSVAGTPLAGMAAWLG